MDSLLFLLAALLVIGIGSAVVALRHRTPRGDHHGIKEFQRNMRALSPEARRSVIDRANVRVRPSSSSDATTADPGEE